MFDCVLKTHLLPPTCNSFLEVSVFSSLLHFPINAFNSSHYYEYNRRFPCMTHRLVNERGRFLFCVSLLLYPYQDLTGGSNWVYLIRIKGKKLPVYSSRYRQDHLFLQCDKFNGKSVFIVFAVGLLCGGTFPVPGELHVPIYFSNPTLSSSNWFRQGRRVPARRGCWAVRQMLLLMLTRGIK